MLCIMYSFLFTSENERIEPTVEELMRDTERRLQRVTDLILENSSPNVRQMFQDSFVQQATRLMKARRRKSYKKRGRKSNRKKLNRKTRRKV